MKTRSVFAIAGAAVLLVGAATVVSAQEAREPGIAGPPGMHGPAGFEPGMRGSFGMLGLPLHQLDLTQDQQDKIKALVDEQRPAIQALRTQLRDAEQAFRTAHPMTTFDETAIREHVAAQAKIQADIEVALARTRAQVAALLTADQLKTVQEMQAKMQERMSRRELQGPPPAAPATH